METSRIADASRGLRHTFIRNMVLPASIGVYAAERGTTQRVRINIDLAVPDDGARALSRPAVGGDDLSRVVDYGRIADRVRALVAAGHVNLVETLAERLAEACLDDKRVAYARVRVEKLDVLSDAEAAGVEIERRQR
jgi:dihydroneopterin aldolase